MRARAGTRHIDDADKLLPEVGRDKVGGARARGHAAYQALRIAGQVLHGHGHRNHLARLGPLREAARPEEQTLAEAQTRARMQRLKTVSLRAPNRS